jgi:hypothetical protein
MLSIVGRGSTLCDGLNRREFLRVGGLAVQPAGRRTRRSCLALGDGQHVLRGWGSRCERPLNFSGGHFRILLRQFYLTSRHCLGNENMSRTLLR